MGEKLVIAEYNDQKQGFLVSDVDRIIRMSWEKIQILLTQFNQSPGCGHCRHPIGRWANGLILDVEKVLAELRPKSDDRNWPALKR